LDSGKKDGFPGRQAPGFSDPCHPIGSPILILTRGCQNQIRAGRSPPCAAEAWRGSVFRPEAKFFFMP